METKKLISDISRIISQNGPSLNEYNLFDFLINELAKLIKDSRLESDEIDVLIAQCGFLKDNSSIMGHILNKPYGYAGDFHIIDRIYTNNYSDEYYNWDRFSLSNSAANAVRNRKEYFKQIVVQNMSLGSNLLNLASGPARDLYELYQENTNLDLRITCVEMDEKAILFSKELNKKYLDKITFIKSNIFRFSTNEKFDLIWSAGLFDYFDDKAFVLLLKKFRYWLKKDGEIIIGNFNADNNPSRAYMELFGKWFLNHRSKDQLFKLALQSGYKEKNIHIGNEQENVNLFMHLTQVA